MLQDTFNERHIPQSSVSALTGILPDKLRDWRRNGILKGIGHQGDNGRWSYSISDVVALWVGLELAGAERSHMAMSQAIHLGKTNSIAVIAWSTEGVWEEVFGAPKPNHYFRIFAADRSKPKSDISAFGLFGVNSLGEFDEAEFDYFEVLNVARLASEMPKGIKAHLAVQVKMYRDQVVQEFRLKRPGAVPAFLSDQEGT